MIVVLVIPAVFNSFGMEPGGRFLRRVFDGYIGINIVIVYLLCFLAGIRSNLYGPNSSWIFSVSTPELFLLGSLSIVTFSIFWILGPQAVTLQEEAFEAISKEQKELAYSQFFRLHMIVRALHLVNLGLAFSLFLLKMRKILVPRLANAS